LPKGRDGVAKFESEEDFVGGHFCGGIGGVVDDELGFLEVFDPIVLALIYKEPKHCLEVLICGFGLPVRLRMIRGREKQGHPQFVEQRLPQFGHKNAPPIRDDALRNPPSTHDRLEENVGPFCSGPGLLSRGEDDRSGFADILTKALGPLQHHENVNRLFGPQRREGMLNKSAS
jgi:hypothetical protein